MPFFWFNDGMDLIEKKFIICQDHSNMVLGKLLYEETGLIRQINNISKKLKSLKSVTRSCGKCQTVLVDNYKICPKCGADLFKTKRIVTVEDRGDKSRLYETLKKLRATLNFARNKKCRLCGHPLFHPKCKDCQNMQGECKKFSSCDFKSSTGYRRADCLFHIKCGRVWLQAVTGITLLPSRENQTTLEQIFKQSENN